MNLAGRRTALKRARPPRKLALAVAATAMVLLLPARLDAMAQSQAPPPRSIATALVPPMGWNGFNHLHRNVTAAIVQAEAQALVSSGMKSAGYSYVNLDGGWGLRTRTSSGALQPDPAKFPQGIKPVADYVHSLGLKFGIYTSAGLFNCAYTSAGSWGHYLQDAATFASWGVDYLKLDWCVIPFWYYPQLTRRQVGQLLAKQMHDALASVGRAILFDVNDAYTSDQPWTWAPAYATLWRTTPDILDAYWYLLRNFRLNVGLYPLAHPGGWNDPDMLEIGNGGMSTTEYVSMFSLWAVMDAPLIAGNDLTTMSATTQSILTNRDVIALDQDPLGRQAYPVASALGHWVLTKPLANGEWAFVLFNETGTPANITAVGTQVGLPHGNRYTWHDLWTGAYSETFGWITATVPAHGVVVYRVSTLF